MYLSISVFFLFLLIKVVLSCFKSDMQIFLYYYLPKSSVSIKYEIGYMDV